MNIKLPISKSTRERIQELTSIQLFKNYNKIQNEIIDDLVMNEDFDQEDVISFLCQHLVEKFGYVKSGQTIEKFFNQQK